MDDKDVLIREKYSGDREAKGLPADLARLEDGEPLAYVIGTIPFLGLSIGLASRPLIPRPETEWWVEELTKHIGERAVSVLDLCAGSGAIGLAILAHCKNARVSFGELMPEHVVQIRKNLATNALNASRADIRASDLFAAFPDGQWDIIATNPPYIPRNRELDASVTRFEPAEALYSGADGLEVIQRIAKEAPAHLTESGELWMECDTDNIREAKALMAAFRSSEIRNDQYGRERLLVAQL